MSRVGDLLTELAGSLLPPKGADATVVRASIPRLMRLLREYPDPIAIRALDDWPRRSRFFPLEEDLTRALNIASGHAAARQQNPVERYDDGMQDEPTGATLEFLKEFRRINPTKCAAYFDPPAKTRWSQQRIGVRIQFVAQIVEKHAPGLLAKHGVRIVEPHRYRARPRLTSDPNEDLFDIEWRWT
jgi:hypothetical protein